MPAIPSRCIYLCCAHNGARASPSAARWQAEGSPWRVLEEYGGTDGPEGGPFAFSASYVYVEDPPWRSNYIDEVLNMVRDLDPYTPGLQGGPTGGVPARMYRLWTT